MFFSKILNILCAFLLTVCLCISVTTLCALRNALDENQQLHEKAEQLLRELDQSVLVMNAIAEAPTEEQEPPKALPTVESQTQTVYRVCSVGQSIGIYTADGKLIQTVNVNPKTLPSDMQQLLRDGIEFSSWEELTSLLQDLTS